MSDLKLSKSKGYILVEFHGNYKICWNSKELALDSIYTNWMGRRRSPFKIIRNYYLVKFVTSQGIGLTVRV